MGLYSSIGSKRLPGKKALIGDNLSSHFMEEVIRLAKENDILFICLPPNSTHLTQPLDVCFFRPVKSEWRKVITDYKSKPTKLGALDKTVFPVLFKKLFQNGKLLENSAKNLIVAFEKTGIFPLNKDRVLDRVPSILDQSSRPSSALSDAVMDCLSELRYGSKESEPRPKRGKKLNVPAGQSVAHYSEDQPSTSAANDDDDEMEDLSGPSTSTASASKAPTSADLDKMIDNLIKGLLINDEEPPGFVAPDDMDEDSSSDLDY